MERLDKILANNTSFSRSEVKKIITKGRVSVEGDVVKKCDQKIDPLSKVSIDGKIIEIKKHIYLMMNKPQGVVSASRDKKEKTVVDILPEKYKVKELFVAGRLDKDTTGFVLITNDGEFAHNILSPKKHIPKTYVATLDKKVTQEDITEFETGMVLGETVLKSAKLRVMIEGDNPTVEVVLMQGLYHQIKRMFKKLGKEVLTLDRIKMGNLKLDLTLKPGEVKELLEKDLKEIALKSEDII